MVQKDPEAMNLLVELQTRLANVDVEKIEVREKEREEMREMILFSEWRGRRMRNSRKLAVDQSHIQILHVHS